MTFNSRLGSLKVSFFFFVTICVALVLDVTNTAVLALCAAAVHECGHLLCMLYFGEKPSRIFVAPFGLSITRSPSGGYRREICIALAGPITNIFVAAVLTAIMLICHLPQLFKPIIVNVALAAFNLIPIEPLDCGRAVRCFLMCRMNTFKAEKTVFVIGIVFLVPLCAAGFYVLVKSRYNITLLLASVYLSFMLLKRNE